MNFASIFKTKRLGVTTDKVYVAGLDSLRGIAILLVLLYHCTPGANTNLGLSSLIFKIASFGWAGVDLFLRFLAI